MGLELLLAVQWAPQRSILTSTKLKTKNYWWVPGGSTDLNLWRTRMVSWFMEQGCDGQSAITVTPQKILWKSGLTLEACQVCPCDLYLYIAVSTISLLFIRWIFFLFKGKYRGKKPHKQNTTKTKPKAFPFGLIRACFHNYQHMYVDFCQLSETLEKEVRLTDGVLSLDQLSFRNTVTKQRSAKGIFKVKAQS